MLKKVDRKANREGCHLKVCKEISGTPERPRLSVYRSEESVHVQIVDDVNSVTLVSASNLDKALDIRAGGNKEAAKMIGELVAKEALEKRISEVVSDEGRYIYHGRAQTSAEATGEAGLRFQ